MQHNNNSEVESTVTEKNIDCKTVDSFGDEWSRLDQSHLNLTEKKAIFDDYFRIFPFKGLPEESVGFDMGCGSGRWASIIAPQVGKLYCIDASIKALIVAKSNLAEYSNVELLHASVDQVNEPEASFDFGYSLGVLHHVPDTRAAIASCSKLLKPGAPFLLYLYYAFDNKPIWYKAIWRLSELFRAGVNKTPAGIKLILANTLAVVLYWPLARTAHLLEMTGLNVENIPLSYYRDKSFYTMRTDSRDRFGTPLEQRFSRVQITQMLTDAGLEKIEFSEGRPFWVCLSFKRNQ